jgi:hypothetical protein
MDDREIASPEDLELVRAYNPAWAITVTSDGYAGRKYSEVL